MKTKKCLYCDKTMTGRSDKKYCDVHCKSANQYRTAKNAPQNFYNKVDNQLRLNRRILKQYNKSGKSVVRSSVLHNEGFNSNFFTHYWKNQKDEVYLFVYEYGFLKRIEHGREKYILVIWQDYMSKN